MECGRRGALGAFAILTLGALKPGCGFQLTGPALSCGLARPQAPGTTGVATSLGSSRWGCRVVRRAEEQDGAAAADPQVGPQPAPKGFAKGAGASDDVSPTGEEIMRMSPKQRAAFWERQKELEKEMDLKEIEEYKEVQRMIDEGEIGFLPEKISERILKRLVPFIAFPVASGIGLFFFYIYLAKQLDISVPPGLVAATTQIPFLVALVGITYSVMSASWDPEREGSFWGWDEFKVNVLNLLDSLQKTKREERAQEKIRQYEKAAKPNRAKRREISRLTKQ